jgi:hypothetical protein
MARLVAIVCSLAFVCACHKEVNYDQPEKGPQLAVPPFQIKIILSEAAAKTLRDAHETIKCAVWFDGDGHSRPGEYTAPERQVVLSGRYEFELDQPGVVSVDHATVSEEAFKRLTETDYYYTIKVYSGRRAFKNNVLDGGYAGGHISEATKKPIEITCDLLPSH